MDYVLLIDNGEYGIAVTILIIQDRVGVRGVQKAPPPYKFFLYNFYQCGN